MNRFAQALDFATRWHHGQYRKSAGSIPQISHPIRVASLLRQHQLLDEDLLCAAMLHDVLEDTPCTPAELQEAFGPTVTAIVQELSDDKRLPKAERKRLQIVQAPALSLPARLIRLADKIDNVGDLVAQPPTGWDLARRSAYVVWAREVVAFLPPAHPGLERLFQETADRVAARLAAEASAGTA